MNFVSISDLIRPNGSVYFENISFGTNDSGLTSDQFYPANLFGGVWENSGTITIDNIVYKVWHRDDSLMEG